MMNFTKVFFSLTLLAMMPVVYAEQDNTVSMPMPPAGPTTMPASMPSIAKPSNTMSAAQFHQWLAAMKTQKLKARATSPVNPPKPTPLPLTYEQGQQAMLETLPKNPARCD